MLHILNPRDRRDGDSQGRIRERKQTISQQDLGTSQGRCSGLFIGRPPEPPTVAHAAGERGEEGVHRLFLGAFGCFETADALFRMLPR